MSASGLRAASNAFSLLARRKSCFGISPARFVLNGMKPVDASFTRAASRSIWSAVSYPRQIGVFTNYADRVCRLHTTGDHELVDFLKDEIKLEKDVQKKSGKLTKIKNFEVTKSDGPNIVFTRKIDNETITIKFNVNNTVEDSDVGLEGGEQQDEGQSSQMTSRPPFVVEINKGGDKTLAIHCAFPHPDDLPPPTEQDQQEQYEDLIEIQDVTLLNKSQEWTDDVYSLSSTVMDGNLYDMLLKLLEERGVDADFIQELIDFSTSYEHKKYVELLEQLKEFADSK